MNRPPVLCVIAMVAALASPCLLGTKTPTMAAEVVARTQQFALAGVTTLEASRTLPDILAGQLRTRM